MITYKLNLVIKSPSFSFSNSGHHHPKVVVSQRG